MICCGFVFGKVLVPVPFSDPDNISTVFQQQKIYTNKKLPFQCQMQHYFPESWPLIFDFLTFFKITFYVGSGSKSGSAKAKSYVS
jgi:hypothetical protein